jgi:hypothetical protein
LEIDQETCKWIEENINLIHWLMIADKKIEDRLKDKRP